MPSDEIGKLGRQRYEAKGDIENILAISEAREEVSLLSEAS